MWNREDQFIGCEATYEEADIVVFGAPFDATTSYRPGTRFGPKAMRNESYGIETYSPYQDKDLEDLCIFDGGNLDLPFGNPRRVLDMIQEATTHIIKDGKLPCMLGGEHLVSLGAFEAIHAVYPDVRVIHFDAHTDLREDYIGEKLSHASVIRRIWDMIGDDKIYQFGIRSGERDEFYWAKEHTHLQKFNFDGLANALQAIGNHPIYFTIDLDVLDPSCFPGTGTPEAGGVSFMELLQAMIDVCKQRVVAVDMNELSPQYDQSGASTALACKTLRELLLALPTKR